jgi:hypothetical protein
MLSLRSGGALGGPGEACVKFGWNPKTLGARAPTKGASPKTLVDMSRACGENKAMIA